MSQLNRRLTAAAADREARGLTRTLPSRRHSELDLASNDYLGLATDPRVVAAAVEAARTFGVGATGSRLVTGNTEIHTRLETEIASFVGVEAALAFSSGYLANLGVLSALGGPEVLVVSDAANHASIIDACRLSRSPVIVTEHRDVAAVRSALATRPQPDALVVTDAVFSVDGDLAPLADLGAVCAEFGATLVVDEAHSLGVVGDLGAGAAVAAGLLDSGAEIVLTATLSKALGSQGGVVLGSAQLIEHLVNTARPFIFDTALAPPAAAAAAAALDVLRAEPERAGAVRAATQHAYELVVAAGFAAIAPDAAVTSAIVGDADLALAAAEACRVEGVRVGCFRPPSVPDGRSRLRITGRSDLGAAEFDQLKCALAAARELL